MQLTYGRAPKKNDNDDDEENPLTNVQVPLCTCFSSCVCVSLETFFYNSLQREF